VPTPYPAPDISRPDINPYSPTKGQTRTLSEQAGKVIVLYFALYT
jgi:peroxiredoxin